MSELEEKVSAIVMDAVQKILRLVDRDDIEVEDVEIPVSTRPAPMPSGRPEPRRSGSSDPILDNFLGTNR